MLFEMSFTYSLGALALKPQWPGLGFPFPSLPVPARNQHGIREAFPPDASVPTSGDGQHSAGQRGYGHVLVAREGIGTNVLRWSAPRVGGSARVVGG